MSALDRRTALLDAAVGEIARRGTRGMRIEQVARAAGVSPALIYHHFGDRSTLLQHALELRVQTVAGGDDLELDRQRDPA